MPSLGRAVPFLGAAILSLTFLASPAFASGGEEGGGGLSFMALHRYDLGIFTLITFGILCAILYTKAWPLIASGLEKREQVITQARDEAIKAQQEAEELRVKLRAEFAQANDKIRALIDEARKDAEALRAKEREAGQREAAAERERAVREIAAAKEVAIQELYKKSVELAALMSSKAMRRQVSAEDHGRLFDESLAQLTASMSAN